LGFDAIEIFAPSHDAVDRAELKSLLSQYGLEVAAWEPGPAWSSTGLSLTHPDAANRESAREFVKQMIDFGAEFSAPAIIGSMQGRWGGDLDFLNALELLRTSLDELGAYAAEKQVPLFYETAQSLRDKPAQNDFR
jgi:sugar phosphate isomerase/epimerase